MNRVIQNADTESFKYFWGGQCKWGIDKNHIYCFYVGSNPQVKIIKSGDPLTFRFLDNELSNAYMRQYAIDCKYVYYYGRRVLKAKPSNFVNIKTDRLSEGFSSSDYYQDNDTVFWMGKQIPELNAR